MSRLTRRRWHPVRIALLVVSGVLVTGWLAVHLLLSWVASHPAIPAAGIVVAAVVSYVKSGRTPGIPLTPSVNVAQMDAGEFEQFVAELCRVSGCRGVERVGGAGDLAADVLATAPDGRRLLVQCKRYSPTRRVGSPEIQRVGGTYAIVHQADLAIVVTTASYTPAAVDYADQAGILLVDGEQLVEWSAGNRPAPWAR